MKQLGRLRTLWTGGCGNGAQRLDFAGLAFGRRLPGGEPVGPRAMVAQATAANAAAAVALAAFALGGLAVGFLAIGRLLVRQVLVNEIHLRRLKVDQLDVEDLRVGKLRVIQHEQLPGAAENPPAEPEPLG